jgi:hypothetical protein
MKTNSCSYTQVSDFFIDNTGGQAIGIRNKRATYKSSTTVEYSNSMVDIVIKDQAIPKEIANTACRSLDEEIGHKKREGALEADKRVSSVGLEWTMQTLEALRAFETAFKADVRT